MIGIRRDRYVGKEAAAEIYQQGVTLEEYVAGHS